MTIEDTLGWSRSDDYRERFKAEYWQLSIRLQKLKKMLRDWDDGKLEFDVTCPRCTFDLQVRAMEDYLAILEMRSVMEGVEL